MTTHDQGTDITPTEDSGQPSERRDQQTERVEPSSERSAQPSTTTAAEPTTQDESTPMPANGAGETSPTSTDQDLFANDELAGLRARWANVQAGFVDDPKECVQKADGLVSDLVEQLTAGFSHARSRLEEQWARGEEASTEDLRIALKRYREFFERLLAV
ncbi:MAG TPA: hypothetical protein VFL67_10975 [Mycobacterium sp.]|nr:hypothetical protein [Mycobacterium sp.]